MWGARRAAGTGLVCLGLAAAGCLEAPPGGADGCPAPDPLPVDPLGGDILTYTFDDDGGLTEVVRDRSGHRLDGAIEGGEVVPDCVYGLCGGALDSVTAMIEVPSHPLLHVGSAFTLEVWVYRSRNAVAEGLISIYDDDAAAGELVLELTAIDGLRFGIASEPCSDPEMVWVEVPPEIFALGTSEWIHVAVTWDGDIVRFYNRGSPVYDQPLAVTACAMDRPLTIGATGSANLPFFGWLDDLKLSSYAKTEGEIGASLAFDPTADRATCGNHLVEAGEDCEPPASCCDPFTCLHAPASCDCAECVDGLCVDSRGRTEAGLVALYEFEEGAGVMAADSSGSGLDLAATGEVAWGQGSLLLENGVELVSMGAAGTVVGACQESAEVTVEAWVTPGDLGLPQQTIAMLGLGDGCQAFALTQEGSRLSAAVSTDRTASDGEPNLDTPEATISAKLTHVVLTRSADGWRRVYLDGRLAEENLVAGDFGAWDPAQRIAVGGPIIGLSAECEEGEASFWRGRIHRLAIYHRALSPAEVAGNYGAGPEVAESLVR